MRVFLAGALLLGGCGGEQAADNKICQTAPTTITPGDMMACVHKWSYRLARSSEPAPVVAKAVVQACNDVANYSADHVPAPSQKTEVYAGQMAVGETEAIFRVIQARAGHCDIP